ncbi:MBL fold metallo-hydrolase [Halalkalibaculum sp. DA3122]|uniref:MBL fold metallo-hydrolase n=1 Tax=unclassified Halalkalibaculum TaxID=2964617 RepID=UPI003754049F
MDIITWSAAVVLGLTVATLVVDFIISAPTASGPTSDHFDGKRFSNPNGSRERGFVDIIKWALTGDRGEWKELTLQEAPHGTVPERSSDSNEEAVFTFVNHATFLIQTQGFNILTDPIWSYRASPYQWIGPRRMRPPGLKFEDLPDIHMVLISHNHYDHLDIDTVIRLNEIHDPLFVVPLGVASYLEENGIYNTVELDWWQRHEYSSNLSVSGVPAQHFSGRGLTDRDKTLWCGYVLEQPNGNIYFAGDTGYDGFFEDIGRRFAPIDTGLIPIGAYRPRWFMRPIHVNPDEAVQIHNDIRARQSIGMHFGTFPLADEAMRDPIEDLASARKKYGVAANEFLTLQEGESHHVLRSTTGKAAAG